MTIPTPVAYWKLDEASGNRADSIGSRTLTDHATVTSTAGMIGNAAVFTAVNSEYLSVADDALLSMGASARMTMAGWFYFTGNTMGLAGKWDGGSNEYLLYIENDSTIRFYVNGIIAGVINVGSRTPTTNAWHFIAARYDGANISVRVDAQAWEDLALTTDIIDGTAAFEIGRQAGVQYLNGRVDELGLWKSALSDAEVDELYNSGAGVTYPFPVAAALYTEGSGFTILNQGTSVEPALEEWTETDHRIKFVAGRGDGVITGCQVTAPTTGFLVNVQAGQIQVTTVLADLAACSVIPSPSDSSAPRIDVLVAEILGSGAAHVYFVQGTAAHHPRPAALPVDTVGLAFVWIGPNLNVITSDCVVDKRCYVL